MAKRAGNNRDSDAPRHGRARAAGELIGNVGGLAFRRFGFIQASVVSRWPEIVGERYARVSSPESIRFPAGRKSGGVLNIVVQGAHAPLMQHLAPVIVERVNRFFGYSAIAKLAFRQGAPLKAEQPQRRPQLKPAPKELGQGLREIVDPELRACLEALAGRIEASDGPAEIEQAQTIPVTGPINGVNH
ncbi:MAG TPA: DciA family protein [Sphingomicrobium sp.]|nr:DciA family protein [Sphingomicrobium sp.]